MEIGETYPSHEHHWRGLSEMPIVGAWESKQRFVDCGDSGRPFACAPASEDLPPFWHGILRSDLMRLAAVKPGVVGAAVSAVEVVCVVFQGGWNR